MDIRSLVLTQDDLPTKPVTIPEWKDAQGKPLILNVRTLAADERDAFEREQLDKKPGLRRIRASIVAKTVVDDKGERIFTDADIEQLGKKNGAALDRLFAAVFKLNKMTKADVEELEKN